MARPGPVFLAVRLGFMMGFGPGFLSRLETPRAFGENVFRLLKVFCVYKEDRTQNYTPERTSYTP